MRKPVKRKTFKAPAPKKAPQVHRPAKGKGELSPAAADTPEGIEAGNWRITPGRARTASIHAVDGATRASCGAGTIR